MKPFWKDEQSIKHRVGTEPRRCFGFGLLCLFKIDFFFPLRKLGQFISDT